jgi:hypothetical protein
MEGSGHYMTLHTIVGVMVDVVFHIHFQYHSWYQIVKEGQNQDMPKKSPPSLVRTSSTTNGVKEYAIFFTSCFSKSSTILLFIFISTQ